MKGFWLLLVVALLAVPLLLTGELGQHGTQQDLQTEGTDVPAGGVPASSVEQTGQTPAVTDGQTDTPAPASASTADTSATEAAEAVHQGTVEKGDTIAQLLQEKGSGGTHDYVSAAQQVFSLRSFRAGQPYLIVTDTATGRIKRFEYEIDQSRRLVVEGAEDPVARVEAIEYTILLDRVEATINDSLFMAVADVGESPQLALQLAEMFGSEINFIRHIQEGDSFTALVENAIAKVNTRAMVGCWRHASPTGARPLKAIFSAMAREDLATTISVEKTCAKPSCRHRWPLPA